MRSYKEYYQLGLKEHLNWKYNQETEWWRRHEFCGQLNLDGDYIETSKTLSETEKNDSSLFVNHTNVKNSEWGILFDMLGQALIDWCNENNLSKDLWSFSFIANKVVDGCDTLYETSYEVKYITDEKRHQIETITDADTLEKFEGCRDFLCDIVDTFLTKNGKDIPCDWNNFIFSLDSLFSSCQWKKWVSDSDGHMSLGNLTVIDKDNYHWDEFVMCM